MDLEAAPTHCITCSDEGLPMRVLRFTEETGQAICSDEAGADQSVAVELLDAVAVGDEILVHAGVAIGYLGRCSA